MKWKQVLKESQLAAIAEIGFVADDGRGDVLKVATCEALEVCVVR